MIHGVDSIPQGSMIGLNCLQLGVFAQEVSVCPSLWISMCSSASLAPSPLQLQLQLGGLPELRLRLALAPSKELLPEYRSQRRCCRIHRGTQLQKGLLGVGEEAEDGAEAVAVG